jgi:shikimate dehydrogenase
VRDLEKLYGLIGCPVSHSMSPLMHNDAFQHLGIRAHYHAFHVEPDHLHDAVKGLRALGVSGFNVTVPHKVKIMEYLDQIDKEALEIGAVNTVVNENGKLIGYNTDGQGFVRALLEILDKPLEQCSILLIGAGGAARGILFSLAANGAKWIDVCNRTLSNAEKLLRDCHMNIQSNILTMKEAEEKLDQYQLIINTTSVGMHPNVEQMPLDVEKLVQGSIVSDIIYNPIETKLLKEAKKRKAITQNGIGMFVYQGALAFEKWTGIWPNIDRMKNIVIQKLGGKIC